MMKWLAGSVSLLALAFGSAAFAQLDAGSMTGSFGREAYHLSKQII